LPSLSVEKTALGVFIFAPSAEKTALSVEKTAPSANLNLIDPGVSIIDKILVEAS
jgi:hypothetical protein